MKKIYAFCLVFLGFAGVSDAQTIIPLSDELVLPQYAYFGGTTAAHRLPFVCRLKLTGLVAGATYRYQAGLSTVNNLTNPPAANQQAPGPMYRINNGQHAAYGYITGYTANKSIAGSEIQNDMMYTQFVTSYNGRFNADGSLPSREYAMQAWGKSSANNPANIANYIAKPGVTHLLSFNEPDNASQSNISVAEAIPLHKLLQSTGLRLGSPAPTESEAFSWLRDFMAGTRAQNIKVDHMVIHWYDWGNWNSTGNTAPTPSSVFNRFKAYVERVYSIYGKPL